MGYFVCRRARLLLLALMAAVVVTVALPALAFGATPQDPLTLQQIKTVVQGELSGQKALESSAYVYRGWRVNGGPWFNNVIDWLSADLAGMGFTAGEGSSADSYWVQKDYRTGSIWEPQYLSMQIVGPDGDADSADPGAYHFDHPDVATFDPTSPYYPAYMTKDWVVDHIGTPEEEAIQDRCHLATNSAFTSPMGTDLAAADAGAIVADLVDIGTVSRSGSTYVWTKNTGVSLSGKVIFTSTVPPASMSNMIALAKQTGARAVMTPAGLSSYSHPTIDGVEWYPNNVRFSGASNAGTIVCLNISYQDARYLTALCADKAAAGGSAQMKLFAVGGTESYSVAPDTTTMLRTLIAEIRGTTKADERVIFMGHVQEPGAEDNASGVAQQLEMVRTYKKLIDDGQLARPRRTLTFMWGAEITMAGLYKSSHPVEYNKIVAGMSNDMVGADKSTTGAVYVIDKMPDPSAQYKYQTDVLAGTTPPAPTQFLRGPDTHTLWGQPSLTFYPYPGHFLNDLYFEAGKLVDTESPAFDTRYRLKPSPWEGGSDASPLVWNYDTVGGVRVYKPIPALATFHFTDYTYHSSMDTMNKLSVRQLRDVGLMTTVFGYYRADADLKSAGEVLDIVQTAAPPALRLGARQQHGSLPVGTAPSLRHACGQCRRRAARGLHGHRQHRHPFDRRDTDPHRVGRLVPAGGRLRPRALRGRRRHRRLRRARGGGPCRRGGRRRSGQGQRGASLRRLPLQRRGGLHQRGRRVDDRAGRDARPRGEQLRGRRRHRHALLRRRQRLAGRLRALRHNGGLHAARGRRAEDGLRPVPGLGGQCLRHRQRLHQARRDSARHRHHDAG